MRPKFIRFNDLNKSIIFYDYHIHTIHTDGSATIEEYVHSAIELGLKKIAFTEHVRKSSEWFESFIKKVQRIRTKFEDRLTIYYGIEAKALDYEGNIDASEEMVSNSELVLGSVHRYPNGKNRYINFLDLSKDDAAEIEFKLACSVLKNPNVDILAHPGGVFERQFNTSFPKIFYEEIINIANQYNKVIEINSSYLKNSANFFNICEKLNPYISLGSDAHNTMELGNITKLIVKELERGN